MGGEWSVAKSGEGQKMNFMISLFSLDKKLGEKVWMARLMVHGSTLVLPVPWIFFGERHTSALCGRCVLVFMTRGNMNRENNAMPYCLCKMKCLTLPMGQGIH